MAGSKRSLSTREVAQHRSTDDCWVVIEGQVWDLTEFVPKHPGGADLILNHAGHDATESFNEVHIPELLPRTLAEDKLIGTLDTSTIDDEWKSRAASQSSKTKTSTSQFDTQEKPPLSSILSSHDFELVAQKSLSPKAWAYYSSAATDLVSLNANRSFFDRIWFRPRVFRNVRDVDTTCSFSGVKASLPVIVAPAAMARLSHKSGEKGIAKACARNGVVQCITLNSSYPVEDVVSEAPDHSFFFQLYVNKDREASEMILKRVWDLGIQTLFLTVDTPVPGKREGDERVRSDESISMPMSGTTASNDQKGGGLTRTTATYIDSSLCWEDLPWLKRHWPGRLVLKGIQTVEDARVALEKGADGIVLSNHGGRNLDTSPPALLTLLEIRHYCPEILSRMDVYIDGGIRRGTDILKALCLGAKAVCIGRTFLYALTYGEDGVEHFIKILQSELEAEMRLLGITSLSQAHPGLVNTRDLDYLVAGYTDRPGRLEPAKL